MRSGDRQPSSVMWTMRDARRCVAECVGEWGEVGWRKESRQDAETNKRKLPPGFQTPARAVAPEKLDRYKGPVETAIKVTRCDPRPTQEQTIQTVLAAKFSGGHGARPRLRTASTAPQATRASALAAATGSPAPRATASRSPALSTLRGLAGARCALPAVALAAMPGARCTG